MECYHVIHVWPALADGRGCFQSSGPRGKAEAHRRPMKDLIWWFCLCLFDGWSGRYWVKPHVVSFCYTVAQFEHLTTLAGIISHYDGCSEIRYIWKPKICRVATKDFVKHLKQVFVSSQYRKRKRSQERLNISEMHVIYVRAIRIGRRSGHDLSLTLIELCFESCIIFDPGSPGVYCWYL